MLFRIFLFLLLPRSVFAVESFTKVEDSHFAATYFGTYRIPSLLDVATYEPGNSTYPVTYNTLFLNYYVNSTQFFGLVLGMEIQPTNFEKSNLYNPALRIGDKRFINTKVVRLSADFRVTLPLNEEARNQKMITAFVSQDYLIVRPVASRFFLDSFAIFRWQLFQQNTMGRSLYIFDRTGLNYDLTEKFGVSLSTINQIFLQNRSSSRLQFDNLRLGPGVYWNWPNIEFNTYFTFNMAQPELKEATLLALLFAKVF